MRYCIHCGESIPDDGQFCIRCGRPQFVAQSPKPPNAWEDVKGVVRTLASFIVICMFAVAIICVAILYLDIPEVIDIWYYPVSIFIVLDGARELFVLDNGLLTLYLIFIVAIAISLALLVKRSKAITQEITMRPVKEHSPLYTVCTLIMASTFMTFVFQLLITTIMGVDPTSPDISNYPRGFILYALADSSVYEELVSRVLLIGLPLLVVDFIINRAKGTEMKPLRRYILGGGFEFGNKELLFLVISSILFGYAHLGTWDVFKIMPSIFAGLAMGFLYLKYGLYASISYHIINNAIGFSTYLIPDISVYLAINMLLLAMVAFGAAYFVNYAVKAFRLLKNKYSPAQKDIIEQT